MSRRDDPIQRHSKKLSWLLRHGARESNLEMDAAGWCAIADVLRLTRMSRQTLDVVVRDNNKSRLQVDGDRIRASQGHSLEGTPVTLDALEASWQVWPHATPLWHGTRTDVVEDIARLGLLPQARTHVHLADGRDSTVGKRAQVSVLLQIDPGALRAAGQTVYASPNGVILVRHVPPACIVGLHTMSRRASREEGRLRAALGLSAQSRKAPITSTDAPRV